MAAGNRGEAIPDCWPARRMTQRRPNCITGKLGYYAMAGETSISQGTWEAASAAADVALTAASKIKDGARAAFALCRPPGHHAARDLYGGYCFLNNAAIAGTIPARLRAPRASPSSTSIFITATAPKIFSTIARTCFMSRCTATLPMRFPIFPAMPTKRERGAGTGFTLNLPLPPGTEFRRLAECAARRAGAHSEFPGRRMVVSLGVDTFAQDPISFFRLQCADFSHYGRMIGACALPTLFVLEGGYAVGDIGVNVVNVLTGFEETQALQ